MPQLHFQMSLEEANLVFKALGELPFKDVFELIGKLNEQANTQLQNPTLQNSNQPQKKIQKKDFLENEQ
jgi:hypothetical protein